MKKAIATGLILASIATPLAACGGSDSAETEPTTTTEEVATVEDVTAQFTLWRNKRASKISNNIVSVQITDVACVLGDVPGQAECYETLKLDDGYSQKTQNLFWTVEYDEATGEILYAESA